MRDYLYVLDCTIMLQSRSLFTVFLTATLAIVDAVGCKPNLSETRVDQLVFVARLLLPSYCTV